VYSAPEQTESIRITFAMPTLNAARTIERALQSIRSQSIPQHQLEILVIDGGSTDATREIALRYGAVVLENPDVVPESAKFIALQHARGDYFIEMDSDEYFLSNDQLQRRLDFFQANPEIQCMLTDRLLTPPHADIACAYLNGVGDPFTYFVYRLKGSVIQTFRKNREAFGDRGEMQLFRFAQGDLLPIADGGASMVSLKYVRLAFADHLNEKSFASTICGDVIAKSRVVGCIRGDDILHDSTARLSGYLKKLKFRVVNNVHDAARSGYSARAVVNKTLQRRKLLFPLYCLSIVLPLLDTIFLSISRRSAAFLLHPLYVYYVMAQICLQYLRKLTRRGQRNTSYGA